jgi:3',5'-cyclic AMP phosphodiesterase CpdA
MKTIVHISDLHFGRTDPTRVRALHDFIHAAKPNVIAVSGDLTQRARSHEFTEARAFIDSLPSPHVVIPGNHDVPLYDVFSRLTRPFAKYRKYFHEELEPHYVDDEIVMCGLNSARGLTIKDGRLDRAQVERAALRFRDHAQAVKIVVTHHPFQVPPGHEEDDIIGRARDAMAKLAEAGADLFLAGHLHATHAASSFERYRIPGHSALVVHAGTATSSRVRGEDNAFNVLHVDRQHIAVDHIVWKGSAFALDRTSRFIRAEGGWATDPAGRVDRLSA